MKNISLALNGVCVVAVAVLYYLHFSSPQQAASGASGSATNLKYAYVKSDTVLKYFEFIKESRERLQAREARLDQDLKNRAASLQSEFEAAQRNSYNMTRGQMETIGQDLEKKRQNLQMFQQSAQQEMMMENEKTNRELYTRVTTYLSEYGQKNGLEVVFKYDVSSDVLFAGDSMDISKEVIKGLNEAYKLEKSKPVAKDTVTKKK